MLLFRGKNKAKDSNPSTTPESSDTVCSSTSQSTGSVDVSPGGQVGLHTKCINQLKKVVCLLVDGAITKAQYDDLQAPILKDMQIF